MNMNFTYDKTKTKPFDYEAAKQGKQIITKDGLPAQILLFADDVHRCSHIVFRYAQLDLRGDVIAWHITTATDEGLAQLGRGHDLFMYDETITLKKTTLQIW